MSRSSLSSKEREKLPMIMQEGGKRRSMQELLLYKHGVFCSEFWLQWYTMSRWTKCAQMPLF